MLTATQLIGHTKHLQHLPFEEDFSEWSSENYSYDPGTNNLLGSTDVNGNTTNFTMTSLNV